MALIIFNIYDVDGDAAGELKTSLETPLSVPALGGLFLCWNIWAKKFTVQKSNGDFAQKRIILWFYG